MQTREGQEGNPMAGNRFATTRWSMVLAAGRPDSAEGAAALEELCRDYWYPVYAFVRRQGRTPEDAQDLTQGFFARLLEKNFVGAFRPERGRFRVFLLTTLKRFLAREWEKAHAVKRGGGIQFLSTEAGAWENRYRLEPADGATPETLFDRRWALVLLTRALEQLRADYARAGRESLFDALKDCLVENPSAAPYRVLAPGLGLTEAGMKQAVHRLRSRYRDRLLEEISHTVNNPAEVEDEMRHLFQMLSG